MPYDIVDFTDKYKSQFFEFYLDPDGWRKFSARYGMTWNKIRFNAGNKKLIPKIRGIYTFTVEHTPSKFPSHGYVLYAGISGDTSKANLQLRYDQYLQYQKTGKGRPAVVYMLRKWPEDLFFSYCALPDRRISLASLETRFLGSLNPPINKKDFPGKISQARKAKF